MRVRKVRIPRIPYKVLQSTFDAITNNQFLKVLLDSIQKEVPFFVCGTIDISSFLLMKFSEKE